MALKRKNSEDFETEHLDEEPEVEGFEITTESDGTMKSCFQMAKEFFPYIIGSKQATKAMIEKETGTRIFVPKIGETGCISVTGADKQSVCLASRRIHSIAVAARKKQFPTHFISIPLVDPIFKEGFIKFKAEVLEKCQDRGISEAIFQSPEKLHLTLCVFVLFTDKERADATAVLARCKDEIIAPRLKGEPLRLRLEGIGILNNNPSKAKVLYGKVAAASNPELLQELLDDVVNFFSKEGLVNKERENVTIHATLMNWGFLARNSGEKKKSRPKRVTFDATNVLENFQDFYFGEAVVTSFEINMLHSLSETGYYKSLASVSVP